MSKFKNSLIALSLVSGMSAQATFSGNKNIDKLFNTLSPTASVKGIVLDVKSSSYNTYADSILKLALKETHKHAKVFLARKEYKKYYTLMLMGLTVPMHEGLFTHFRKVKNISGRCNDKKNSGGSLKDQKITKDNYIKGFSINTKKSFFAKCSSLKANQNIIQMVAGGGDGSDLGIMQLSARWHYEDFLAKKKYTSAKTTLGYGNKYLYRGFNAISRNAKKYKCILNKNGTINHLKLARATWGGWYNAGGTNIERVCRFANPNSEHKNKDLGFNSNLQSMIKAGTANGKFGLTLGRDKGTGKVLGFWPKLSASSRAVIKEIHSNIVNNKNKRTQLKKVTGL